MMNSFDDKQLLVVSSYPEKGKTHGKATVGIASYAKNTLTSLSEADKDLQITVLAEKFLGSEDTYTEGNISVKRVWKRGSLTTFSKILSEITKNHKKTKNIMVELELAMFGSAIHLLPITLFLQTLKLMGKKVTVVLHQVIPNIDDIAEHINLKKGSRRTNLYSFAIQTLYRSILLFAYRVIVFDEVLKNKLKAFGKNHKVYVIPHGVEEFKTSITPDEAREKLGLKKDQFIVLSFGFLAWYKGTDWLVDAIKQIKNKDIKLILAGGPNPNHLNKPFYKKYIDEIEKTCDEFGFIITGFVDEDDIATFYQASDLVVLPYRTLMSASGPLSIALSFKKPFLVSKIMEGIFETNDIKQIMNDSGFEKTDLSFDNEDGLSQKIQTLQGNHEKLKRLADFSEAVSEERKWNIIGQMYKKVLFS